MDAPTATVEPTGATTEPNGAGRLSGLAAAVIVVSAEHSGRVHIHAKDTTIVRCVSLLWCMRFRDIINHRYMMLLLAMKEKMLVL